MLTKHALPTHQKQTNKKRNPIISRRLRTKMFYDSVFHMDMYGHACKIKAAGQLLATLRVFHNKEPLCSMTRSSHQQQLCDHCQGLAASTAVAKSLSNMIARSVHQGSDTTQLCLRFRCCCCHYYSHHSLSAYSVPCYLLTRRLYLINASDKPVSYVLLSMTV